MPNPNRPLLKKLRKQIVATTVVGANPSSDWRKVKSAWSKEDSLHRSLGNQNSGTKPSPGMSHLISTNQFNLDTISRTAQKRIVQSNQARRSNNG